MRFRHWLDLTRKSIRTATDGFSDDELMTRAAALSFYSALSFAPLLVLLLWVLAALRPSWQGQLVDSLTSVIGQQGAGAVRLVIDNAQKRPRLGNVVGVIGLCVTLFSASAVFAQLQSTLNRVWKLRAKPGEAVVGWLKTRARAFGLLVGVAFLLIVSFVISGLIQAMIPNDTQAWQIVEAVISFAVFVVAFGAMYRILPDAEIAWKDATRGGNPHRRVIYGGQVRDRDVHRPRERRRRLRTGWCHRGAAHLGVLRLDHRAARRGTYPGPGCGPRHVQPRTSAIRISTGMGTPRIQSNT
ncbi:MAG: hypothetical protein GAK28_03039 [Luteibacter sp.]|nr:MAG: hypothetical protein GAK28_03039 [Luteibacter sp.]